MVPLCIIAACLIVMPIQVRRHHGRFWVLVAVIIVALAVLSQPVFPQCKSDPGCDARGQLAMDYMHELFGDQDSSLDIWLNHLYGQDGKALLMQRQRRLNKLTVWAKSLKPEDRNAYEAVIEWYQDGIRDALAEWNTHAKEKEMIAYEKHLKECARKAESLQADKTHALPRPPQ
jgi:hypothetical protein